MESNTVANSEVNLDTQELYDWGIEDRLQYYGTDQQQQQYQYQQQQQINNNSSSKSQVGYILPEHVQENNYLVATTEDQKIVKIPGQTLLPMSPLPPTQIMVKTEANKSNKYKPPQIKPNGIPGRRPMLPTVDMDANELMKVERKRARNRVAASKCRMRKLERIAVLDNQANALRNENDQLAKLAEKLRSQVYSLRQELRWHLNNGCRIAHQNIDQLDQDSNLVPSTVDKSTETNFEFRANSDSSPDSTTTTVCVKKEPPCFEEPPRKTTL